MKLIRRDFLNKLGVFSIIALFAGQLYTWIRSLFPNVTYGKSRRVRVGHPDRIPDGVTFLRDQRLYVFRDRNEFYAISAVCTHLGCTVNHRALDRPRTVEVRGEQKQVSGEFHCPCHGSRFYDEGTNFAGPAPRPLPWVHLELAPEDGSLIADLDRTVDRNTKLMV